jgi:hypothetical protein
VGAPVSILGGPRFLFRRPISLGAGLRGGSMVPRGGCRSVGGVAVVLPFHSPWQFSGTVRARVVVGRRHDLSPPWLVAVGSARLLLSGAPPAGLALPGLFAPIGGWRIGCWLLGAGMFSGSSGALVGDAVGPEPTPCGSLGTVRPASAGRLPGAGSRPPARLRYGSLKTFRGKYIYIYI